MGNINTLEVYDILQENFPENQARSLATTLGIVSDKLEKKQLAKLATREELEGLKQVVVELTKAQLNSEKRLNELIISHKNLTERVEQLTAAQERTEKRLEQLAAAQERTEKRLDKLTERVEQLAAAQERTEKRLEQLAVAQERTEKRLEQLAAAQNQTEKRLDRLTERVDQLAAAQERTEKRLDKLAAAQERTEKRVEQLFIAQEKTEKEIQKLTKAVVDLRKDFGGLSNTFGYVLEDRAIKSLPKLLKEDYNIEVTELKRDFIEYDDENYDELNIFGYGVRDSKNIVIIGEAKYQLSQKHIDQFQRVINRVKLVEKFPLFSLIVCSSATPKVKKYAEKRGIALYYSYQLDL